MPPWKRGIAVKTVNFVVNRLMALWLIVLGVAAYLDPDPFLPVKPYVNYLLGLVILVMSLTLTKESLEGVVQRPKAVITGFLVKWITVPLVAFVAARLVYAHQPQLAAGTILDGSVPAGVSSNLFTFLAHGSVAVAITLSSLHTLLAPLLTPAFTSALASRYVPVSFASMFLQLVQIIVVPLILGLVIRYAVGADRISRAEPVLPVISALALYLVEVGIISGAVPAIRANLGWVPVVFAVTSVLILVNLALAYVICKALHLSESVSRAIMFDVGIYNSGLGAGLAAANFGAFAALPPMANMVMNLIIGALLAAILQNYPTRDEEAEAGYAAEPAAGR